MIIQVKDASDLTNVKLWTIIGIGDKVYEVVPLSHRWGTVHLITDGTHKIELKLCEMGKVRSNNASTRY